MKILNSFRRWYAKRVSSKYLINFLWENINVVKDIATKLDKTCFPPGTLEKFDDFSFGDKKEINKYLFEILWENSDNLLDVLPKFTWKSLNRMRFAENWAIEIAPQQTKNDDIDRIKKEYIEKILGKNTISGMSLDSKEK